MLIVGLAYAAAACAKLRNSARDWVFDGVVRNHVIEDFFAKGGVNPHGWRLHVATWIATSPFVGLFLVHADADVVERRIAEIRTAVAGAAVGFSEEQFHAPLGRLR